MVEEEDRVGTNKLLEEQSWRANLTRRVFDPRIRSSVPRFSLGSARYSRKLGKVNGCKDPPRVFQFMKNNARLLCLYRINSGAVGEAPGAS